jgi:type IV secretion system protein VirB4
MASTKLASLKFSGKKRDKSSKELEALKDIADDVIESDFVPYACLFDASTIVTKDGELLQTLKITGLGYDSQSQGDLRSAIRAAIKQCIPDASYAIWLHTLRRKQAATSRAHFPDSFSGKIDEAWRAMQPNSNAYVNELYVSFIKAGEDSALLSPNVFKQSLLPLRDRTLRTEYLEHSLSELNRVTDAVLARLAPFGAKRLTTVEREGIFYNEQIEFLEKLINLEERPMPLPERDLSHVLTSGEITFGFNAMEVRTADGHRRFAAILTLKEYKESTLKGIDSFLEIPCELIISQCFDFTGAEAAREAYEKQAKYLTYSGDKDLAKWIEIDRLMHDTDGAGPRAYGQQQTTIFLISPGVNQLETNVRMVQRALNRLGMVVIREDLRFEECYWSQLPANFTFISRKHSVDTEHIAGFVNLQAAPMGNALGSPWGPPVTVFTTVQEAPYHFNFHRGNNAHTIVLGKHGSGKTSFAHLLLAQSRKLNTAIWYLDVRGRSAPFMHAMGGQVLRPGSAECKLNPLQLAETPANREFLALWLSTLVDPTGLQLNRSTLAYFQSVIDRVLQVPRHQRRMSIMVDIIRQDDGLLAAALQRYVGGNIYGELFDMPEDNFAVSALCSWQIGQWMADPATRVPLTGYLLHRLTGMLNRSPTMIVLDEGFEILDTPLFSARIGGWCDYLSQNNAAVMMLTDAIDESALRPYSPAMVQRAATIFAMPDKQPEAGYSMGFGFTPEEINTLSYMDATKRQVLQKRGPEAVVIRSALGGVPQATLDTLSGKQRPAASPADTLAQLMGYTKQMV